MIEWTKHPVLSARLEVLWNEGLSAQKIAAQISKQFHIDVTKNSIIGAARRMGLPPRQSPIRPDGLYGPPTRETWMSKVRRVYGPPTFEDWLRKQRNSNRIAAPKRTLPRLKSESIVIKEPAPPPRVSANSPCCWPIGEPGTRGFRYCDAPGLVGKSYCPEHHKKAHIKTSPEQSLKDVPIRHWGIRSGLGMGR